MREIIGNMSTMTFNITEGINHHINYMNNEYSGKVNGSVLMQLFF